MSLFPTLQQIAPRATLLYDCFPGLLTRQTPSQFGYGSIVPPISAYYDTATPPGPCPAGNAVVCWQRFTGTDPVTGFAYPNTAPLFAYNGGTVEGFGMYVIDQYFGFTAADPVAAFPGVIGVTTETNTVRGVSMTTLKANHFNHVPSNYSSGIQSHFLLYRNINAVGFTDLDTGCVDTWIRLPDHSTLLNSSYKFRTFHDYKSSGDFRYGIQLIYANATDAAAFHCDVGKIGVLFTADTGANGVGVPFVEFIRMKNFSIDVPLDFFKSTMAWIRSTDYSDLTSGRFIYRINDQTVFDVNPNSVAQYNIDHPLACTGNTIPTNCINRHKGPNNNPWQRLFLVSNYFGGIGGKDVQFELARLRIWNRADFVLPAM